MSCSTNSSQTPVLLIPTPRPRFSREEAIVGASVERSLKWEALADFELSAPPTPHGPRPRQLRNQTRGSQLGSTVFCDYTTMYTSRYTLITHTLRLTEPEATRAGARAGMTYCGAKAKKRRLQSRQPCSSKRANCDLRRDTSSITVSATKITAGHTSYACAATDRKKRLIMRRMISFSAGELSRKDPSSW